MNLLTVKLFIQFQWSYVFCLSFSHCLLFGLVTERVNLLHVYVLTKSNDRRVEPTAINTNWIKMVNCKVKIDEERQQNKINTQSRCGESTGRKKDWINQRIKCLAYDDQMCKKRNRIPMFTTVFVFINVFDDRVFFYQNQKK